MKPTFEDLYYIHINDMKGTIDFDSDTHQEGVISLEDGASFGFSYSATTLLIKYYHNGNLQQQFIETASNKSNLGDYNIYYLKCPNTGKKVDRMYIYNGRMYSRHALNLMYESQAKTKQRGMFGAIQRLLDADELQEEVKAIYESKYFTPYYNGKPTKRMKWILNQVQKIDSIKTDFSSIM